MFGITHVKKFTSIFQVFSELWVFEWGHSSRFWDPKVESVWCTPSPPLIPISCHTLKWVKLDTCIDWYASSRDDGCNTDCPMAKNFLQRPCKSTPDFQSKNLSKIFRLIHSIIRNQCNLCHFNRPNLITQFGLLLRLNRIRTHYSAQPNINREYMLGSLKAEVSWHRQSMSCRGAPDEEFCYPARSGSMPDPYMSGLAGSGSEPDPSHWIQPNPDPNLDYCRQQEKNYCFCTTIGKAGMTVYPILWPNFYSSDN